MFYLTIVSFKVGYDQQLWDNDAVPEEIDKYFECLSEEQQDAARTLGYDDAAEWNGPDAPSVITCDDDDDDKEEENTTILPTLEPTEDTEDKVTDPDQPSNSTDAPSGVNYYEMPWNELPEEAQEAARSREYTVQLM